VSKVLSDINFIKKYDLKLGELYQDAKNVYLDGPIQTLVELRSILELICIGIVDEYSLTPVKPTLSASINVISSTKTLAPFIIEKLNILRADTNKAAHKHNYELTPVEFSALALNSLKSFCELIEDLQVSEGKVTIPYVFDEKINSRFYELSYRAMFEEDNEAKFIVGMALVDKYRSQSGRDERPLERGIMLLEEAAFDKHPEAMFEYGYVLIHGTLRDKDFSKGVAYLYSACVAGLKKANTPYAEYTLERENPDEESIKYAISFLNLSVDEGNAHAQYVLSEAYRVGKHIERDDIKALALLKLSAEGGYALACFKYGMFLLENDNIEGEAYFENAVINGNKQAWLYCARIAAKQMGDVQKALKWYLGYLRLCPVDYDVMFEISEYAYSVSSSKIGLIEVALRILVQAVRDKNLPLELKVKANHLSKLWLPEYYKQLILGGSIENSENVFVNYSPDGTIIDCELKVNEVCRKITNNPSLRKRLIYTPKGINRLNSHKRAVITDSNKQKRNEPCNCKSGKKYKNCCA